MRKDTENSVFLWKFVRIIWIRFYHVKTPTQLFNQLFRFWRCFSSLGHLVGFWSLSSQTANRWWIMILYPKLCALVLFTWHAWCALAYLVMIDRKPFFLLSVCFFFNSFQNLSNNMFLTISRWPITEKVVEEEAEDKNQQNDSKCRESRLVIQFQG